MRTSPKGIYLIKQFEGFRPTAYQDVVNVWSIGYGFTKGVRQGDTMTRQQADMRLAQELGEYEDAVLKSCAIRPNQNQFDALVCFAWNVGIGGMQKSSVIKAHNRGDHQAAGRAFGLWNKAGGKVYPGLTRRRAAEAALYLEPMPDDMLAPIEGPMDDMPQAVDPERPMHASSINRAGVIAGGSTAVVTATQTINTLADLNDSVGRIWTWQQIALPVLGLIAVLAVGYIIVERIRQRHGGWA